MIGDLPNCPFCGSKVVYYNLGSAHCQTCKIHVPEEIWKKRVEPIGIPDWLKEKITEKIMPGSIPGNYETVIIMDTLKWVLSLKRDDES